MDWRKVEATETWQEELLPHLNALTQNVVSNLAYNLDLTPDQVQYQRGMLKAYIGLMTGPDTARLTHKPKEETDA